MKFANTVSWIILAFICNFGGCSVEDEQEVPDLYVQRTFVDDMERLCVMDCEGEDCIVVCMD